MTEQEQNVSHSDGQHEGAQMDSSQHSHEQEHDAEKDTAWAQTAETHAQFLNIFGGNKEAVIDDSSAMSAVFKEHMVVANDILEVGCIDERCGHQGEGYHLGLGGAGILVPEANQEQYVQYLVDTAVNKGVKTIHIHAHQGCGAAKLSLGAGDHSSETVNQRAQKFTQELAGRVKAELANRGISDIEVIDGYLSSDVMHAPAGFHNSVGAILDMTGEFDPTRKREKEGIDLPPFFNINGTFDYDHSMANVGVALSIAFGDHGFGSARFNADRPFVITLVHNEKSVSPELVSQLDQTVADFATTFQEKNGIDIRKSITVKILRLPQNNVESSERPNIQQVAFDLTKQVLQDPVKVDALKKGVSKYTQKVDVEFQGKDIVLSSENASAFDEHRGIAYMLWGSIVGMLQRGEQVTLANLTEDKLSEMIYQAYVNSGASGM